MRQYLPENLKVIARRLCRFKQYWLEPVLPLQKMMAGPKLYRNYLADWFRYKRLPGAEPLAFTESYPQLFDVIGTTPYDPHYFYQAVWAMERIARRANGAHVDIGSDVRFVGMLTTHLPVTFVDIRPLETDLPALTCVSGSITNLPFNDGSVNSLSCLHVVEHVGLGRYGDLLNPVGTRQACAELARVLAPAGDLYFSTPVGRPRVCFNAHRIHSPQQILNYFQGLELVEFSGINDQGKFCQEINVDDLAELSYACGLFHFTKRS